MRRMLFIVFLLIGCSTINHQKLYPLPKNGIRVIENKIYYNSELFAELRYFRDDNYPTGFYRGVAIYYHQYDKEVWIFPKKGWSIRFNGKEYFTVQEIDALWNQYQRDRMGIYKDTILLLEGKNVSKIQPSISEGRISEDGKYIYFKTFKYLIEYGISESGDK